MDSNLRDAKWHVVYTMPRAEKKVASSISIMGIEAYLPLHKTIRQWSDRKKTVEFPLFPNYVFVKVSEAARGCLYSVKDLLKFVSFESRPAVISEEEIKTIKIVLNNNFEVFNEQYITEGTNVRIRHGQFAGLEGTIDKKYGNMRFVVKIHTLMKAYSFNVPANLIEVVEEAVV